MNWKKKTIMETDGRKCRQLLYKITNKNRQFGSAPLHKSVNVLKYRIEKRILLNMFHWRYFVKWQEK